MLIAVCVMHLHSAPVTRGADPRPTESLAVYAKIVLPIGHPYWSTDDAPRRPRKAENSRSMVESWIARASQKHGKTKVAAVTGWILLGESDDPTELWSEWGCPVHGSVAKRTTDGRIEVELSGWAPFQPEITGQILTAEIGSRGVAVVDPDEPSAYVGLLVVPRPQP